MKVGFKTSGLLKVGFKTNGQITYTNGGLNIGFKIMNTKSIYIYKNIYHQIDQSIINCLKRIFTMNTRANQTFKEAENPIFFN